MKLSRATPDASPAPTTGFGVYIHFPWCVKKCPYCDFLSVATDPGTIPHAAYADAIIRELSARSPSLRGAGPLRSVFFGGGTPSLWAAEELGRVLRGLFERLAPEATPESRARVEVSVECNPSSLDRSHADALARQGVNRLSLGIQSLDEARLRFLGRWHTAEQGLASLDAALESEVRRVSADLIIGVAGQKAAEAAREAETLARRGIGHLSAYTLTVEPGTVFGARARAGTLPILPEEPTADAFLAVRSRLRELGFEHYEISNHARPGQRAQHNLGYWLGRDYLGLGCGAVGTLTERGSDGSVRRFRYYNARNPRTYLEALAGADPADCAGAMAGSRSEARREVLEPETSVNEALLLGLRLREGVDTQEIGRRFGSNLWTQARQRAAKRQISRGNAQLTANRLRIPEERWLLADGIIADLL